MLELNWRNLTTGEAQNCVIGTGTTPPQFRVFGTDKTSAILTRDAAEGWKLFSVFNQDDVNVKKGVQIKDGNLTMSCSGGAGGETFKLVGQVKKDSTLRSEFLLNKSWDIGDIFCVAFLLYISMWITFVALYYIFKRKTFFGRKIG